MAYVSKEEKARISELVKPILKKYGMKGTLAVNHHSTLVLNLSSGKLDIIGNASALDSEFPTNTTYMQINQYWFKNHFSGTVVKFFEEVIGALNDGNWDESDIQTDYFSCGWYVNVNVGRWNKPYTLVA